MAGFQPAQSCGQAGSLPPQRGRFTTVPVGAGRYRARSRPRRRWWRASCTPSRPANRDTCARSARRRRRTRRRAGRSGISPRNGTSASVGQLLAAAVAEDLVALAVVADEIAHVLDDAQHRHAHLAEHLQPLAGVDQADVLRRRDDDGPGERRASASASVGRRRCRAAGR